MHRVAVLALPGVIPFELGIPARVFGAALSPTGEPLYDVVTCSSDGQPVRSNADYGIAVGHGPEVLSGADTVVVPPAYGEPAIHERGVLPAELVKALAQIRPGTRTVSICLGAFVLAAVGLLDGHRATTHWHHTQDFRRLFPQVSLDPDVLFVADGDVFTSAGAAAGVDLCLHIVRRDHGSTVANTAARICVVPPWREGGQAQYIERPVPESSVGTTAEVREWARHRLDRPLTLAELAARARMSVRTFSRRFRDEAGCSPGEWLATQRLDLARHLLETTDLSVERIAERSGFGAARSLRQHFQTALGVAPMAYRTTFRGASKD